MQRKQSKNLRRNISETWKMWQDKNTRKECSKEKNYQEGLLQENYLDGQIRNMTKNTGEDWREIGDSRKKNDWGKEKWKCVRKLNSKPE